MDIASQRRLAAFANSEQNYRWSSVAPRNPMLKLPSCASFISIVPRRPNPAAKPVQPLSARAASRPAPVPKPRVKAAAAPIFHGIGAGSPKQATPAVAKPQARRASGPLFRGIGGVFNPGLSLTIDAKAAAPEPQRGLAALPKSKEEIDASWRRAFARVTKPFSSAAREPVAKGPNDDRWDEAFARAGGKRR